MLINRESKRQRPKTLRDRDQDLRDRETSVRQRTMEIERRIVRGDNRQGERDIESSKQREGQWYVNREIKGVGMREVNKERKEKVT